MNSTNGIVIVSGPTGSGKSTTLAAALREKDTGDTNIVTAEDLLNMIWVEILMKSR